MTMYYRTAASSRQRPTAPLYDSNNYLTIALKRAGIKFAGIVFFIALSLIILANSQTGVTNSAAQTRPAPPSAITGPPLSH